MPNNIHLIAIPADNDGLRLAIGEAHRRYSRRVDFREGSRGHLWLGRFCSWVANWHHASLDLNQNLRIKYGVPGIKKYFLIHEKSRPGVNCGQVLSNGGLIQSDTVKFQLVDTYLCLGYPRLRRRLEPVFRRRRDNAAGG